MNETIGDHLALAALSLPRDPLADVGRAAPDLDAFSFRLCQKRQGVRVDQLHLCEFDGNNRASVECGANDFQVFCGDAAADAKDQTLSGRKSVDSAGQRSTFLSFG